MSLPTVIAAIAVAVLISAIAAAAGYYLQVRMRRLEQLEEELPATSYWPEATLQKSLAPPPPIPPCGPPVEEKGPTKPLRLTPSIAASLVVTKGDDLGARFGIERSSLIGRDPSLCDLVLHDESVSRQHARVRQEEEDFFIYDLTSVNGTFVNGELVTRALLRDGNRISVGNTELEFRVEGKE